MRGVYLLAGVVFLALLAISDLATAATVTVTGEWTAPTSREDGAALTPAEIAGYRLYFSVDQQVSTDPASSHISITSGLTRVITVDLTPRAQPYTLRAGVRAVDTSGRISALSPIATKVITVTSNAPPRASASIKIEASCSSSCTLTVVE